MAEWSLPVAFDVVAAAVPEREVLVCGSARRSYAEVAARTRGLAAFLTEHGLGVRRERNELDRWECGQSPVALLLYNCAEYVEAMLGCYRARAVPFNVNQHYRPAEVRAVLDMVGAEAVIYHRALGPLLAAALDELPVLIDLDDGSGVARLDGAIDFEAAVATVASGGPEPVAQADDLYVVCTGGTTGSPKAVLWRQGDIFVAGMGGSEDATPETLAAGAERGLGVWYAAPPLMHAAAQWTAFAGIHGGATIVMHDDSAPFDACVLLDTMRRERVNQISIVGDAYARPLIEAMRENDYDLSALQRIGTGGATTSAETKAALFELLPHVMIIDGYGASETGGMAFGARTGGNTTAGFAPAAGAAVLSADRIRFLAPGDDEVGWIARRGRVPLGYLGDATRTEQTFPIVDGERMAVPGDRATLDADGTIGLLGRDSMVVNTGGEKVFVEEVESVLRSHPAVVDALVVGRPSERFGQEVVGLVQMREGKRVAPAELREFVAEYTARFKAPRAIAFCSTIGRHPSGKPDYQWAQREATHAVSATDGRS